MKILSIYPYTHISSCALMINGNIKFAPEERFNRIVRVRCFLKSMEWCLKKAKLKLEDIDLIRIPWNPAHNIKDASSRWVNEMRWRGEMLTNIPVNILKIIVKGSRKHEIKFNTRILYLNHHECHVAFSSFFYFSI